MSYPQLEAINGILAGAQHVVVVQADNPDADSLGSALALEQVLGDMGKQATLYCGVSMPVHLQYLAGWDRVERELPRQFDASIIVDASTPTLLEKLRAAGQQSWLASKPCVVLDHHAEVQTTIPYATVIINDPRCSSTGELIYRLAKEIGGWPLNIDAQAFVLTAILGDTQGLSNQLAAPQTYRVVADILEAGVSRTKLEDARREASKMPPLIFQYKARLITRTELLSDGRIAIVSIPQQEISTYSPLYNPGPLIQGDMLQTAGVQVSIVLKSYDDGKITAAIRCNSIAPIAADLASHFGGGGHQYASGFKIDPGPRAKPLDDVRSECIVTATRLLDALGSAA